MKSASAPLKRPAFVAAGNGNAAAATRLSTKAHPPARFSATREYLIPFIG